MINRDSPQADCSLNPVRVLPSEGCIGVIAPAGPATLDTARATQWMQAQGYGLRIFPGVFERDGYLAGSDEVRLRDLHDAFADPDIDAIICLRGGYGSPRLLDRIDYELLRDNPKPFVGYSDLTAVHQAISRYSGFVTFHGPMLVSDLLADKQQPTQESLFKLLRGDVPAGAGLAHPAAFPLTTLEQGVACGRLVGGNLSIICATLATDYEIDTDGSILFIEDIGEPLYRIDRLLTQLRLAGKLDTVRGVLVGDFAGLEPAALNLLLRQMFQPLGIPVLAGWRSGHCNPNLTLPMGARVRLDASTRQLMLEQTVVE